MDTETKSMLAYSDIYPSLKALKATKPSASCGRGKVMDLAYPEKIINLSQSHKPAYQYTTPIAQIEIKCNTQYLGYCT